MGFTVELVFEVDVLLVVLDLDVLETLVVEDDLAEGVDLAEEVGLLVELDPSDVDTLLVDDDIPEVAGLLLVVPDLTDDDILLLLMVEDLAVDVVLATLEEAVYNEL